MTSHDIEKGVAFQQRNRGFRSLWFLVLVLIGIGIHMRSEIQQLLPATGYAKLDAIFTPYCRDYDAVAPKVGAHYFSKIETMLHDDSFKNATAEKLAGAVRIPTQIGDDVPNPKEDPDFFAKFFELHEYLKQTYPLVHENLKLEKVNDVALLYTWEGSDQELKPAMFMAHQDVVLVNEDTIDQWTYPPYSGYFDGEKVWGRGSSDCKTLLTAELVAIEELIRDGFTPRRTILLAFGFDEESSGEKGALELSKFIEKRYGADSIFSILDEGMGVFEIEKDLFVATPVVREKGFLNVQIDIQGPGGHSSLPPSHTNVGILSELVYRLENDPFEYNIENTHPFMSFFQCVADHSKSLNPTFRKSIKKAPFSEKYKKEFIGFVEATDPMMAFTFKTSQAIDVLNSGIKVNALPETGRLLINYRIDFSSNVDEVINKIKKHACVVAEKYTYSVDVAGEAVLSPQQAVGSLNILPLTPRNPSPASPDYRDDDVVWELLATTVKDFFQNRVFVENNSTQVYLAPGTMTPNTDTRHMWNLTNHIYRFQGAVLPKDGLKVAHSVNEYGLMSTVLQSAAFMYEYILGADALDS
ncbi:LAFE_0F08570g1_1 [Lachancea fermentati]|uniref:LAFE_0F08570g1_1 n=1 Tax=Lachancea fermentati TaxID=4955 RepID=A0A1G4MFA0_LACFM|nr:LAFE_0F08570g1_1 [Lachancea fermentati]